MTAVSFLEQEDEGLICNIESKREGKKMDFDVQNGMLENVCFFCYDTIVLLLPHDYFGTNGTRGSVSPWTSASAADSYKSVFTKPALFFTRHTA